MVTAYDSPCDYTTGPWYPPCICIYHTSQIARQLYLAAFYNKFSLQILMSVLTIMAPVLISVSIQKVVIIANVLLDMLSIIIIIVKVS